jgi:mannose-6-phosphate isomerase-like protein (cupin superfamily)
MSEKISRLLTEGKTYLWALRHSQANDLTPEKARQAGEALAEAGLDLGTLAALRQLEPSMARFPHPSARRADHGQYYFLPIPAFGIEVFFNSLITEQGLEAGLELFPGKVDWQFGHREVQYCIGGDTKVDMISPDNRAATKRVRVGDVIVAPAGANFITHSSEEEGRFGHAHVFLVNDGGAAGQVYYDVVGLLRLQTLGLVQPPPGGAAFPFSDVGARIEVKSFRELLSVHKDRERDLPTWLRNGWGRREEARALDYAEGTRNAVMSSPDRPPADFIEWGEGPKRCFVSPLVAESAGAVTDCRFPEGYRRLHTHKEIWTVLSGRARVRQSIPPLHNEWPEIELSENDVMAAAGGAHFHVVEATGDFVVRRMTESCAHNGHAAMMDRKLQIDGVVKNV